MAGGTTDASHVFSPNNKVGSMDEVPESNKRRQQPANKTMVDKNNQQLSYLNN